MGMWPFGTRAPCAHCGKKVRKPKDPTLFLCPDCKKPGPWATPEQTLQWETTQAEAERQAVQRQVEAERQATDQRDARVRYAQLLADILAGPTGSSLTALSELSSKTGYSVAELTACRVKAARDYTTRVVSDDLITPDENDHLHLAINVLGLRIGQVCPPNDPLGHRLAVASANGGFLPEVPSPHVMAKKGELVHAELPATLLKDVTIRQTQGGSTGFSFPIGKTGIRYRVGGYRGQSVEVGTKRVPADSGLLVITSTRAVFLGNKKTVEMLYSKLVNLTVFSDGVQFHQSNRVAAPVFTLQGPDIVAAYVHAAAQRVATG
jgi:hypothetical protein